MKSKRNKLSLAYFLGGLFFVLLFFPDSKSNANSLMSVNICSSVDTITEGDTTKPKISWTSSGADRGGCTVSSNLPSPPAVFLAGGSCVSGGCSNGARPVKICSGGSRSRTCTCTCADTNFTATSQAEIELPTPSTTTTYSVTCRRSDGRGGSYVNTACAKVTVKPYVCSQNCLPANTVCLGTPYKDTNCNQSCGVGTMPIDYDSYTCTHDETPDAFCGILTNCGKPFNQSAQCGAIRTCVDENGIKQPEILTPASKCGACDDIVGQCAGCQLKVKNNGWREIAP